MMLNPKMYVYNPLERLPFYFVGCEVARKCWISIWPLELVACDILLYFGNNKTTEAELAKCHICRQVFFIIKRDFDCVIKSWFCRDRAATGAYMPWLSSTAFPHQKSFGDTSRHLTALRHRLKRLPLKLCFSSARHCAGLLPDLRP